MAVLSLEEGMAAPTIEEPTAGTVASTATTRRPAGVFLYIRVIQFTNAARAPVCLSNCEGAISLEWERT